MNRRLISSLLARCGAAPLALAVACLLPAAGAAAQVMGGYVQPGRPYPGQPEGDEEEDFSMDDPRMGMFPGMRGGRPEADAGPKPKTDLGKKIVTLDFTRTPQTVLAARAKLAAAARERLVNPEEAAKEEAAEAGEAAEPGMPAGMPPEMMEDMPPELLQLMQQQMQAAMQQGGAAPGAEPPTPADPAAKAKAEQDAKGKAAAAAKAAKEAEHFRLLVVAGEWQAVGEFLRNEAKADADAIYTHVLNILQGMDSALVPDEVLAISEAAPADLNDKQITKLGNLLKATKSRGSEASAVAARIKRGTTHFGGEDPAKRKRAASLLVAAGLSIEAVEYLAPVEQARQEQDAELLNLHAAYYRALLRTQKGAERQDSGKKGWDLCREVLALPKATAAQRARALEAALVMLPEVPADEADAWLASLFKGDADIGWKAIDMVNGRAVMQKQRQARVDARLKALTLVRRLGTAIMDGAGEGVAAWRAGLDMLTMSILAEAEATKAGQNQPNYEEMMYGGYGGYPGGDRRFQPIPSEQLAAVLPDARWLTAIDPGLAAKFEVMVAATTAGSGDTEGVLQMIRPVAETDPKRALRLATALLGSWSSFARAGAGANDPYMQQRRMAAMYGGGYYPGMYGGGSRSFDGAIPLTRAKQHRNLEKLQQVLAALAAMKVGPLPPNDVAGAFAVSHSDAEVYQIEDIERVFGPVEDMEPAARLKLAETMRQRLGTVWRNPQVQQQAGTRRTDKELTAEIKRGYALAMRLVPSPEFAAADDWAAATAAADLRFDLAEFLYGQKADLATYSGLRDEAFAGYRHAADLYAAAVTAGKVQPTARVYVQWFSSALGASDLGYLTRQNQPDLSQAEMVGKALASLPVASARKHLGLFAQEVTRAAREVNPELKARFARQALKVVADHPDAATLRKTVAFYDDLDKEVELNIAVDGPTEVGHKDAFGVQVSVWSTRAVSREAGGFSKYLRNEQWNPQTGQPINYKDDLEKQLREKLSDKFEVASITFHKPEVQPVACARAGWEQFPIAYVLLKAKDPSVDRLPPLQLDMDFADGQGTVILPVASPVTLINARADHPAPRAVSELAIEQVLDDRTAAQEGAVKLEVRAKARGLVPGLDSLLDLAAPKGFSVAKVEDHGLSVAELDTATSDVIPLSERVWSVEFRPAAPGAVSTFAFPTLKGEGAKLALKRYSDADLVDAPAVAAIGPLSGPGRSWGWIAAIGAVLIGGAGAAWYTLRRRATPQAQRAPLFTVPATVTPVNSIALLRKILAQNGSLLPVADQAELDRTIGDLERRYFAPGGAAADGNGELRVVVERWVRRVNA